MSANGPTLFRAVLNLAVAAATQPWAKPNLAALFGVIALRDAEIAIEREPRRRHDT